MIEQTAPVERLSEPNDGQSAIEAQPQKIDKSGERSPLFPESELSDFRRRWQDVQTSFVDDPRSAVRNADELVSTLVSRITQIFSDERGKLEHDWDRGEDVSTEDLRLAVQRYRSFFDRLLSL